MVNYEIIRRFTTDRQIAKAWKEYTNSVSQNYESFVTSVNELVNLIPDDNIGLKEMDATQLDEYVSSLALSICGQLGVDINQNIFCVYGDQTYLQFVKTIILKFYQDDDEFGEVITPNIKIVGNSIRNYPTDDIDKILSDINATFHSSVVENAIAAAYDQSDILADRINLVRDSISEKFTSGFIDVSGYLTERMTMMKNGATIIDVIQSTIKDGGFEELQESDTFKISDCNAYQFTGATPTSAYCWNSVGSAITSGVKVAAKAVVGIAKGIFNIGKKLFGKATEYIKEVVVDPYDLAETTETDANPTIQDYYCLGLSGMSWPSFGAYGEKFIKHLSQGQYHMDLTTGEVMILKAGDFDDNVKTYNECKEGGLLYTFNRMLTQFSLPNSTTLLNPTLARQLAEAFLGTSNADTISIASSTTILEQFKRMAFAMSINTATKPSEDQDISTYVMYAAGLIWMIHIYTCVKPKPVLWSQFKWFFAHMQNENSNPNVVTNIDGILWNLSENYRIQYCNVSSSETELYNSFVLGLYMTKAILLRSATAENPNINTLYLNDHVIYMYKTTENNANGNSFSNLSYVEIPVATMHDWANGVHNPISGVVCPILDGSRIGNSNFLNVATGTVNISIFDYSNVIQNNGRYNSCYALTWGFDTVEIFKQHIQEEIRNPLGYEFMPYDKNNANFYPSKFRIKTDTENINRFNNFITTTVILIAVAIVSVTLVIKLRKAASLAQLKLSAQERHVSEKLFNGTATKEDLRALRKAKRKTNKLLKLTGNTTQALSAANSSTMSDNILGLSGETENNEIIRLITGR